MYPEKNARRFPAGRYAKGRPRAPAAAREEACKRAGATRKQICGKNGASAASPIRAIVRRCRACSLPPKRRCATAAACKAGIFGVIRKPGSGKPKRGAHAAAGRKNAAPDRFNNKKPALSVRVFLRNWFLFGKRFPSFFFGFQSGFGVFSGLFGFRFFGFGGFFLRFGFGLGVFFGLF